MLKKGDIVEYVDSSPDAWFGRKGSIGIVTQEEYMSGEQLVSVSPISTPDTSAHWPRSFFATVWKKIGHSE